MHGADDARSNDPTVYPERKETMKGLLTPVISIFELGFTVVAIELYRHGLPFDAFLVIVLGFFFQRYLPR